MATGLWGSASPPLATRHTFIPISPDANRTEPIIKIDKYIPQSRILPTNRVSPHYL
jgi:hypothetical protein